jgi:hypothetical protein
LHLRQADATGDREASRSALGDAEVCRIEHGAFDLIAELPQESRQAPPHGRLQKRRHVLDHDYLRPACANPAEQVETEKIARVLGIHATESRKTLARRTRQ